MTTVPFDDVCPYAGTYYAYYKGKTVGPMPKETHDAVVNGTHDYIVSFLRDGKCLDDVKAICVEQLETMRQQIIDVFASSPSARVHPYTLWGKNFVSWNLNISALLKLKAMVNDDNNGWLCMKIDGRKLAIIA